LARVDELPGTDGFENVPVLLVELGMLDVLPVPEGL
jgi:hypothetical protein